LSSNGVPFDVAFRLDDIKRKAWSIIISEQQSGMKLNWSTGKFEAK
jgi:hypothetical protein